VLANSPVEIGGAPGAAFTLPIIKLQNMVMMQVAARVACVEPTRGN